MTDWLLYKHKAARLSVSTDVDKKVSNQVVIFVKGSFFFPAFVRLNVSFFTCYVHCYFHLPLLLYIFFFLDSMVVALCLDAQVEKEIAKLCKC